MNIYEAIKLRHSVREYEDRPIGDDAIDALVEEIAQANFDGGLDIQLRVEEPEAFIGGMARYGAFKGVRNYIALVGPRGESLDEKCGYYGERIVLAAQMMGLNTCWVGLSYNKSKMGARISPGEACPCVISLGYGHTQGRPHKVKLLEELCRVDGRKMSRLADLPRFFTAGLEAAQLAPTALNQQKFFFDLIGGVKGDVVCAGTKFGPYSKVDLGIARYHFEVGADSVSSDWRWA